MKGKRGKPDPALMLAVLKALPRGVENAVTSGVLRRRVGAKWGRTNEVIRFAIRDLIDEGVPIGSNSRGFYIITSNDGLKEALGTLEYRLEGLQTRMDNLTVAYEECRGSVSEIALRLAHRAAANSAAGEHTRVH